MDRAIDSADCSAQITGLYIKVTGELTPHSVDTLNDALATYPPHWLIQVLNKAKDKNIHSWRWCEVALEEMDKKTPSNDPGKYTQGGYGHVVITSPEELERHLALRKQARNCTGNSTP